MKIENVSSEQLKHNLRLNSQRVNVDRDHNRSKPHKHGLRGKERLCNDRQHPLLLLLCMEKLLDFDENLEN